MWRGEFVVGSGGSRCRRLMELGRMSLVLLFEVVGIGDFQFPFEGAWVGAFQICRNQRWSDSSPVIFLPSSPTI